MRGLMVQKMKEVRPPKRKGVVAKGSLQKRRGVGAGSHKEGPPEEERKEAFQKAGKISLCAPRGGAHQIRGGD